MKTIPINSIHDALRYDPNSGLFFWKPRDESRFASKRAFAIFNSRFLGKRAGSVNPSLGYVTIHLDGAIYYAHRVAWALYHGEQPERFIDHVNGDRADNRIANLRITDRRGNATNRGLSTLNTSGHIGVHWAKNRLKWQATIRDISGTNKHIGYYDAKEDAVDARREAERSMGYHQNHGMRDCWTKEVSTRI